MANLFLFVFRLISLSFMPIRYKRSIANNSAGVNVASIYHSNDLHFKFGICDTNPYSKEISLLLGKLQIKFNKSEMRVNVNSLSLTNLICLLVYAKNKKDHCSQTNHFPILLSNEVVHCESLG